MEAIGCLTEKHIFQRINISLVIQSFRLKMEKLFVRSLSFLWFDKEYATTKINKLYTSLAI